MRRRFVPVVMASLLLGGACYDYVPVSQAPVTAGEVVRATLTDQGTADLGALIGPSAARVTGKVIARQDSAWVLGVTEVERRNGVAESWRGEHVTLPTRSTSTIERRSFAKGRSSVLAALLVGGLAAATGAFHGGEAVAPGGSGHGTGTGK